MDLDRRKFIEMTAAGIGALGLYGCTNPHKIAPSDWVNVGVIGAGNRGQHMMQMLLRVPGVRITGLCDVYEPRFAQGRKITGEQTPVYSDYRKMLEAKDIDAVMVASPLGLHADHVTAALESGRHVYGEKSLGRSVEDCCRIRDAAQKSGKLFQVGLQYTYAPWYQEALRRIRDGKIGQVTHIYSYWHRNNNWRRPVPKGSGLEHLLNWRLYKQWSGGLLAELGSHQINFANAVFGTIPESVVASGGVDYWKDGREIEDNVQATYRYPGGRILQVSCITTNRLNGAQERIFGTGGSVVLTHTDATYYKEPADPNSAVPPDIAAATRKIITGPTYSAEQPYTGKGERPLSGKAADADLAACQAFIDCIRQHRRPLADEKAGWNQGVTVALGNKALETGQRIAFSDYLRPNAGAAPSA